MFAKMKIFAFFISFYILVLSSVPCNDMGNKCNKNSINKEHTQNHDHQQDTDDNCTPFCTCSCCSSSVLEIYFTPFCIKKPIEFSISQKITIRNFSFVSNYFGNIWQPPKITIAC